MLANNRSEADSPDALDARNVAQTQLSAPLTLGAAAAADAAFDALAGRAVADVERPASELPRHQ